MLLLGANVFPKTDDPEELASIISNKGYKACYWPEKLNIDSWGQINFEVHPINRMLKEEECFAPPMAGSVSYDMDIEPDDIEVSDTVTLLWEIE